MRLLLFGGTFNPVHWGHLILAEELREEFAYDLVLFVPAARPPHKDVASDPGPEARLAMLQLAREGNPHLAVDDCELYRPGPSYSIDTIRGLSARYSIEGLPGLVIGDDLAPTFSTWREAEALARESDILIARRGGYISAFADGREMDFPYRHRCATNRLIPLSSSEIRERIAAGRSVRYLVPESVFEYIRRGRLYGSN